MNINIAGRHFEVTDAVKQYVEERLDKIGKHFDRIMDANVTLNVEKFRNIADINININGVNMHSEEQTPDMYTSIDRAVDKIERQVKRYKDKLLSRKRQAVKPEPVEPLQFTYELLEPDVGELEESQRKVIKSERHQVESMTLDEAVMQMDLNHEDFFVFTNSNTQRLNVVYRRADGNVGWIAQD